MSKSNKKQPAEPRSVEALTALLHCKGGPMRDRRCRREKEKKHAWRKEEP